MLVYAFDLLYSIYEEMGYKANEIPQKIFENNLYGIEIDERAGELAAFSLIMKARERDRRFIQRRNSDFKPIEPNICVLENVKFSEDEIETYMDKVGRDLFTTQFQTTLRQFEEADNFGSLIQPALKDIEGIATRLKVKGIAGDLFLSKTHNKVIKVLKQSDYLCPKYHVVITNPPYMGSGGMNANLGAWLKINYSDSKADLLACFMERATELTTSGGFWGMINLPSWMFLSSFEKLRLKLIKSQSFSSLIHLGRGIFGSDFGTVAFVFLNNTPRDSSIAVYRRLFEKLVEVRSPDLIEKLFLDRKHGHFTFKQSEYLNIPGYPIAYWLGMSILNLFKNSGTLGKQFSPKTGMTTGDDARFLRQWYEPSLDKFEPGCSSSLDAKTSSKKWFPYNKGGIGDRWFGHCNQVINWENDGVEIKHWVVNNPRDPNTKSWSRRVFNYEYFFKPGITWTLLNMTTFNVRYLPCGSVLNVNGPTIPESDDSKLKYLLGFMNSKLVHYLMLVINPTVANNPGNVSNMPLLWCSEEKIISLASKAENITHKVWDSYETSWGFSYHPLIKSDCPQSTLVASYQMLHMHWREVTLEMKRLEEENNRVFIVAYNLQDELTPEVRLNEITLTCNPYYRYGKKVVLSSGARDQGPGTREFPVDDDLEARLLADTMKELISYTVGCIMGRYSMDAPGLIYANSGNVDFDKIYQEKHRNNSSEPRFFPDEDGIIPITDIDWFNDDAVNRFIEFISIAWPKAYLEENLRFIADALEPKQDETARETLRRHMSTGFYKHHLTMYKKRPIYWLFTSGKERAFQCLVYLHRYNESTLARIRTEYVIPLQGKINARIDQLEGDIEAASSTAFKRKLEKEKQKLVKQRVELQAFDEKLHHFADMRISLDLDDGVKVNYAKFGDLLAEVKAVTGKTDE
ncbi:MAG: BREX-1 system adenine-specific DNA-methyltransferase PglX [Deltaproteobacteria bacterium]|nr:BREX-1 system adenine-specific DNA-methyltransferase PglX [Deltaproteobacteria bacterium]